MFFAGQICGVEGYVESIATGLLAGMLAASLALGCEPVSPPRATALGSLVHYVTKADAGNFQPANITFDLLPRLEKLDLRWVNTLPRLEWMEQLEARGCLVYR